MKKTILMFMLGCLGWTVVLGSAIAFGDDAKAYPGSACTPNISNLSDSADIQELLLNVTVTSGVIFNQSFTKSYQVVCPVVRDNTTNTTGLSGNVLLYASTNNIGGDIRLQCRLAGTKPETGALENQSSPVQANLGDDQIELKLQQSTVNGGYVILCRLPARSQINAYVVTEF
jgi:hypothetical protein